MKSEDTLITVFGNSKTNFQAIEDQLHTLIKISAAKKTAPKLIMEANVK